jgi:PAS domain S-box-containing protein
MGAKDRRLVQLELSLQDSEFAAAALRDSELRYRRLFESARDGILILDAVTGRVIDANPFLQELLGYTLNEMCGEFIWDLGVLRDIAASQEAFRTLQENEYIRYDDLPLETRDGRPVSVEFVSNVYTVDKVEVIQCNIRDISARRLAKADNRVSAGGDITGQPPLAARFQEAQKLEAVGLLAGGVAHDYNNMLTVILGNAELALQDAAVDGPLRGQLEGILKAARRSAGITRQLLTFARRQSIAPVSLDLNGSIDGMIAMIRKLVGEAVELAWTPGADLWPVRMDPVEVSRVLASLCVNARDSIADTGRISIETCNAVFNEARSERNQEFPAGEYVMLAVRDDGSGMTAADLDRIFEPQFTTKASGRGTGLGLSSVDELVRRSGGFINVHSVPGSGTTVRVYLRRYECAPIGSGADPDDDAPRGHGETVLVVEDEPDLLHMAGRMLTRLGYEVLAADSPSRALALAAKHRGGIRILLTDVAMPQMNGRSLATRLRADCPGMGLLFMSGYAGGADLDRSGREWDGDLIHKPFSTRERAVGMRAALNHLTSSDAAR